MWSFSSRGDRRFDCHAARILCPSGSPVGELRTELSEAVLRRGGGPAQYGIHPAIIRDHLPEVRRVVLSYGGGGLNRYTQVSD
jgi:hypothetical protein